MIAPYPTLDDIDVANRAVLLRVDFNIKSDGRTQALSDDFRLKAHLPTIRTLLERGARLGLLTHRGRPQGQPAPELSTLPLARALEPLLGQPVVHIPDCIGAVAKDGLARLKPGEVAMLENTRFHLGEQINHPDYIKALAEVGDIFVNDAFAVAHRPHASVSGLAAVMPSVIGPLMVRELGWLEKATVNPARPLVCILGGTHVAAKLELIDHLLTKVDTLILGGAVAHTFLASRDMGLGQSLLDPTSVERAREIFTEAGVVGCRLLLPHDFITTNPELEGRTAIKAASDLRLDDKAMDLGPQTVDVWSKVIQGAGTVLWLGSLGAFETPPFHEGTLGIANAVQASRAFTLVAGDGLLRALKQGDMRRHLPHVSSGGGVLMAALMGRALPPLQVLKTKAAA